MKSRFPVLLVALVPCLALVASDLAFTVGFGRTDITPPFGIDIPGYLIPRHAKEILDPLEVNALAFSDGGTPALVLSLDTAIMGPESVESCRTAIERRTGVKPSRVHLCATHIHSGGGLAEWSLSGDRTGLVRLYHAFVAVRCADAAAAAIADLKPARLSCARTEAKRISFVRSYYMKDGSVATNPGVNNPDIVKCVGEPDEEVQLLRIDREGGKPIAVINFQTHPDVVGGEGITADWPGFTRRFFEGAFGGEVLSVLLNGAQGDVNHVCVDPAPRELNGLKKDFDDVWRGYDHAKHMGATLAGAVLSVWYKCDPLEAGPVRTAQKIVHVAPNKATPEELVEAKRILKLHAEGRDAELPWKGMGLTTALCGANRMVGLENRTEDFELPLSAIAIGASVVFDGFPGEPFCRVGQEIKRRSPFKLTIPTCLTNGGLGYFPYSDDFKRGGYESAASPFAPSVVDVLIDGQLSLLSGLAVRPAP